MKRRNRVSLPQDVIDTLAANAPDQGEFIISLFRAIIPEFDLCEQVCGYPVCSTHTWLHICQLCMDFDKVHHPNCVPGGAWLNYGFANDPDLTLKDFEIEVHENMLERRKPLLVA